MIRINLLKPETPQRPTRLVERRELWTGVLLLAIGGGVLFLLSWPGKAPAPPAAPLAEATLTPAAETARAPAVPAPPVETRPVEAAPQPAAPAEAARAGPAPPRPAPGVGVFEISAVSLQGPADALVVVVRTDPRATYRVSQLNAPNRIVVDFPNMRLAIPAGQQMQAVQHAQLQRVRASQFQLEPPLARLVLDVAAFPIYHVRPGPDGVEIRIEHTKE